MVIAAVGVVSVVPSGLITNGLVTLLQESKQGKAKDWQCPRWCWRWLVWAWPPQNQDWGDATFKMGTNCGWVADYCQQGFERSRSSFSQCSRVFIFTVMVLNVISVLAVLLKSETHAIQVCNTVQQFPSSILSQGPKQIFCFLSPVMSRTCPFSVIGRSLLCVVMLLVLLHMRLLVAILFTVGTDMISIPPNVS